MSEDKQKFIEDQQRLFQEGSLKKQAELDADLVSIPRYLLYSMRALAVHDYTSMIEVIDKALTHVDDSGSVVIKDEGVSKDDVSDGVDERVWRLAEDEPTFMSVLKDLLRDIDGHELSYESAARVAWLRRFIKRNSEIFKDE